MASNKFTECLDVVKSSRYKRSLGLEESENKSDDGEWEQHNSCENFLWWCSICGHSFAQVDTREKDGYMGENHECPLVLSPIKLVDKQTKTTFYICDICTSEKSFLSYVD